MLKSNNLIKILFLFLVVVNTSCKQNITSKKLLNSSENLKNKSELKTDSLDLKINALMTKHNIPGVNIALIENGKLNATRNYGVLQKGSIEKVDDQTMFSVGSVSKVVSAILTLKLVKEGKLNLGTDVNNYLTGWKVEQNKFNKDKPVTLRHILSHTAGFSVHGFDDYYPEEKLPTTLEILNGTRPAKNKKVELLFPVGSKFKYSGGGFTVIQKIIEDVIGLPYHQAASQILFETLKLERTTFKNTLPTTYGNIAKAHDKNGNPVALPRGYQAMPEMAASGLWTTLPDFSKLLTKLLNDDKNDETNLLSPKLIEDLITKEKHSEHGLGPYISLHKNYRIVEHRGSNDSYKSAFVLFWNERKGYIIFTNGSNGMDLIIELGKILEKHYLNL